MEETITVILYDMPTRIKEYVIANHDSSYTIVLNAKHSFETRCQAYLHAVKHIKNGDFEKDDSSDSIEARSHKPEIPDSSSHSHDAT